MQRTTDQPSHLNREDDPAKRLASKLARKKLLKSVEGIATHTGFKVILDLLNGEKANLRRAQNALNLQDDPNVFIAHKERSSYVSGRIQGIEFLPNTVEAMKDELPQLEKEIKQLEKELKTGKK